METEVRNCRFTAEFQSSMKPGPRIRVRPEMWFYFISWPIVFLLGRTWTTPNQVGFVSLISGLVFIGCLFAGVHIENYVTVSAFLFIRLILDCADGQLARYTSQTSSLGALYDLVSDFLFSLFFSMASAYTLVAHQGEAPAKVFLLAAAGFFCSVGAATVHSYFSAFFSMPGADRGRLRKRFVRPPENDRSDKKFYSAKLNILSAMFNVSWGLISRPVIAVIGKRRMRGDGQVMLLMMSPAEYTVQLVILLTVFMLRIDLVYYYLFQVGVLIYVLLLTALFDCRK